MPKGGFRVHEVWYEVDVWTDDFDGVGTSEPLMTVIMEACHNEWAAKQTLNKYMAGVQRNFHPEPDGTQHATMLMPSYIDGIVALCHDHLIRAGWTNGVVPTVPFPKEQLTLHDPMGAVTDHEANTCTALERGFNTAKGLTMWADQCRLPERKLSALKGRFATYRTGLETQCHDEHGGLDALS